MHKFLLTHLHPYVHPFLCACKCQSYTEYFYYSNNIYLFVLLFLNSYDDDDETLKKNTMFIMPLDHYSYIDNTAHHEVIFQLPVAAKKVTPKAKETRQNI